MTERSYTRTYLCPHRFSCLTEGQIGEIQAAYADVGTPVSQLAKDYDVSGATIRRVIRAIPSWVIRQMPKKQKAKLRLLRSA